MESNVEKVKRALLHLLIRMLWIFPINKNKVLCMNFCGRGFGDNGKAVVNKLYEKKKDLEIVWAADQQYETSIPQNIHYVKVGSLQYYYDLATAGVWLDNVRKGREVIKRKGQYYVQLWHGGIPLKKIEKDVEKHLTPSYVEAAQRDSKMVNLIPSSCELFTEICRRAFWYDGEILKCGEPRLDTLFNNDEATRVKVRDKLEIDERKRVVLYAPTFRDDGRTDCYKIEYENVLKKLQEKYGEEWVFLVRLHPNIADKADFIKYTDLVRNATFYPDLYELLSIVDVVITDYSSLMFEGGVLKKPVFLFATDIGEYTKERDFYFNLCDLPFSVAQSNGELISQIKEFDRQIYEDKIAAFFRGIGCYEMGKASEAIADRILEALKYE